MKQTKNINTYLIHSTKSLLSIGVLMLLAVYALVGSTAAQTLTQSYQSDEQLQRGTLVTVDEKDETKVEAATLESSARLHGVVVDANDAPVTLSEEGQQIFVASSGQFEALVSDENGSINTGDYIVISSIRGVGMKAGSRQGIAIGKALVGFDGNSSVLSTTTKENSNQKISISRILIDVGAVSNPHAREVGIYVPKVIKGLAENVASKHVSDLRIYFGLGALLLSSLIAGSILYAGVKSSITAIGRNPLSKPSIIKGLLQVVLTSLIIFLTGIFAVYLLLKL